MKNVSVFLFTMLVFALFAGSGFALQKSRTGAVKGYDPKVTYAGEYKADLVFFRYTEKDYWRRRPRMDRLESIYCQDASVQLTSTGKWRGFLDKYGSCGNSDVEAPEWAVGNRLNYDDLPQQGAQ